MLLKQQETMRTKHIQTAAFSPKFITSTTFGLPILHKVCASSPSSSWAWWSPSWTCLCSTLHVMGRSSWSWAPCREQTHPPETWHPQKVTWKHLQASSRTMTTRTKRDAAPAVHFPDMKVGIFMNVRWIYDSCAQIWWPRNTTAVLRQASSPSSPSMWSSISQPCLQPCNREKHGKKTEFSGQPQTSPTLTILIHAPSWWWRQGPACRIFLFNPCILSSVPLENCCPDHP